MTPYAEALERQLDLLHWCDSAQARTLATLNTRRARDMAGNPVTGDHIRRLWAKPLAEGAPYFWSEPMCVLLEAAAPSFAGWRLRETDFPSFAGFCLFARRLTLDPWVGDAGPVALFAGDHDMAAFTWSPFTNERTGEVVVTFVVYDQEPGFVLPTPVTTIGWELGRTLDEAVLYAVARDKPTNRRRLEEKLRYVATALALLGQTITATRHAPVDRAARRRAERAGWEHDPIVRVVELRRRVSESVARDAEPVEWSCRWVVRGHWRQQWCPLAQEHRPIWITSYVKGPEDKPLKTPRATVFAVVR
jgi:hypothetical protein